MLKEHQRLIVEGTVKFPSKAGEIPHLLGNKCSSCGKVFFPKRAICPNCFTDDTFTDYELSTRGKNLFLYHCSLSIAITNGGTLWLRVCRPNKRQY